MLQLYDVQSIRKQVVPCLQKVIKYYIIVAGLSPRSTRLIPNLASDVLHSPHSERELHS